MPVIEGFSMPEYFSPDPCSVRGRECEGNALQMSKLDFNDDSEKKLVEQVFGNAMESLADEDRQLPQVSCKFTRLVLAAMINPTCAVVS